MAGDLKGPSIAFIDLIPGLHFQRFKRQINRIKQTRRLQIINGRDVASDLTGLRA